METVEVIKTEYMLYKVECNPNNLEEAKKELENEGKCIE